MAITAMVGRGGKTDMYLMGVIVALEWLMKRRGGSWASMEAGTGKPDCRQLVAIADGWAYSFCLN